jgi:hypothetical protein
MPIRFTKRASACRASALMASWDFSMAALWGGIAQDYPFEKWNRFPSKNSNTELRMAP